MDAITLDNDLYSLGKLVEILQASPGLIRRAAEVAGIIPTLRLNGVAYFSNADIDAIREKLHPATQRSTS